MQHPSDPNSLEIIAQDVINIMSDFIQVIEAEHVALHSPKIDDYKSIIGIKLSLTNMYEHRVKDLKEHPDFPHKLSKKSFEQLQSMSLAHYNAIAVNEKRLNLLIRTTFEILSSVVGQVRKIHGEMKSYGKKGKAIVSNKPISVTLDTSL